MGRPSLISERMDVEVSDLRQRSVESAEDLTVDRPFLRPSNTLRDPLAEELGREAVMTMTSADPLAR